MKKNYQREEAQRLLPLLEAITNEIRERSGEVRVLEGRERSLERDGHGRDSDELAHVTAKLASERRELRLAAEELERLGCFLDPAQPDRVLIPGTDGKLLSGFLWRFGASEVEAAPVVAA